MAVRPAFFVGNGQNSELVRTEEFNFNWYPGFSFAKKQKNVTELHSSIHYKYPNYKILEISSKSDKVYGRALSAFNLKFMYADRQISVESAFQSSKVFEDGKQYTNLLNKSSREAKTDFRIRNSGNLKKFLFAGEDWDLHPTTAFYDWLYIHALHDPINTELAKNILGYDCFTDIEFNPKKSFNCQARSAALYKYLYENNLLEESMSSKNNYMRIIKNTFNVSSQSSGKKNLLASSINNPHQTANLSPERKKKIQVSKASSKRAKSEKIKNKKISPHVWLGLLKTDES